MVLVKIKEREHLKENYVDELEASSNGGLLVFTKLLLFLEQIFCYYPRGR
jgi:hypothetical protein